MSNISYYASEITFNNLKNLYGDLMNAPSVKEAKYQLKLYELCKKITDEYDEIDFLTQIGDIK